MKVSRTKETNNKWTRAFRGLKLGGSNSDDNGRKKTSEDLPWGGMGPRNDTDNETANATGKTIITPKNIRGVPSVEAAYVEADADKNPKNHKKLDEYGFIVNIDDKGALRDSDSVDIPGGAYTPSPDTPKRHRNQKRVKPRERRQMKRLQYRREKKWIDMLKNWDEMRSTRPKRRKMRQRIRKGVPNSMRGEAWTRIAKVREKVDKSQKGVYAKLVSLSCEGKDTIGAGLEAFEPNQETNVDNSVMRETIERDLTRTFPRHSMFYDAESDSSEDEFSDGSFDKLSSFDSESFGEEHVDDYEHDHDHEPDKEHEEHLNTPLVTPPTEDNNTLNETEHTGLDGSISSNDPCCGKVKETSSSCLEKVTANCPPSIFTENKEAAFEPIKQPHHRSSLKKKKQVIDFTSAEGGQAKLRRVLRAYSIYDSEVGYCQGMNFIAGMFITFVDEEEAFWLLVHVMCESPCRMRGLFSEGMTEAHQVLHVADRLIQQFHPRLARHFERQQIHITMFATQWLLTVYTSSFPFDVVTRVWDTFLAEGWKVAYRVMLALLEWSHSQLMKMQFEEILNYIKEMPFEIDSNDLLEAAFKIPLKKRHITKYAKEWEREQRRKNNQR